MLIKENEIPRVALNDMNEVHDVEIEIVNKLYDAIVKNEDAAEILKYFDEFLNDVINHFTFEQGLMEKYNFFAYPMHRAEHDRVLYELKSLEKILKEKGDIKTVKDYLENVFKPWIINHVQTMDTVTAMYLSNFV
ncbi:MAG TPA: hemerythrin [Sulfurihydrogenibium sp.]|uniref:bacteriohemerythrin n=1 Tax=Sulfurihydrogenibium sp. (strain YO3AOP1) TaxID=436114 RepID=UPI0001723226|nr:hemerythrin family protein [Sulfurihydrogenibium sp. YO3AOP1]ACD67363.1 hemerythrin-like metal-binding protein [Sulfurihydrogenibium sp. YO3AOP1]HBT99136.1 hemerythrin [Sulfurihydrogenibium sp.]